MLLTVTVDGEDGQIRLHGHDLADRMPGNLDPRVRSERRGTHTQAPADRSAT